jgi:hypothetical protein
MPVRRVVTVDAYRREKTDEEELGSTQIINQRRQMEQLPDFHQAHPTERPRRVATLAPWRKAVRLPL